MGAHAGAEMPVVVCLAAPPYGAGGSFAKLLECLGLRLGPADLLTKPGSLGPEGGFAHTGFTALNEALLRGAGGAWDYPQGLPEAWATDPALAGLREQAARLIEALAGPEPWGWHDPRNCLTLPFWRALVPGLRLLACLGHPAETASALAAVRGSSELFGWKLWERYARGLRDPGGQVFVTRIQVLLADPDQELERIARFCGLDPSADLRKRVLREALPARSRGGARPGAVPAEFARLHADLLGAAGRNWTDVDPGPVFLEGAPGTGGWLALHRENEQLVGRLAERERVLQEIYASRIYSLLRGACRAYDLAVLVGIRLARRLRFPRLWKTRIEALPALPALPAPRSYDIFCLPIIDWEFRYQRPQQLLARFAAKGHRVFYLRTEFHGSGECVQVEELQPRVYGLRLPGPARLNLYRHRPDSGTLALWVRALERFRLSETVRGGVCLVHLPFWAALALEGRRRWGWQVVYDCMDEHAGFATTSSEMLALEEDLFRKSDLVVTTAAALTEKARGRAGRLLVVPNGADYAHFSAGRPNAFVAGLPRPVIGYFGAIAEWFDAQLVARAAGERPAWSFVLVGRTAGADLAPLKGLKNVHLTGERAYGELPGFLAGFDVACIPFKVDALTRATNPVKFFEYLSAGKPVVATELPELAKYDQFHRPIKPGEGLVEAVENALERNSLEAAEARRRFARANTWEARHESLAQAVAEAAGRAAIVVVSYKLLDDLRRCLESIWRCTFHPDYRVIVVDNGSGPDVVEYLRAEAARQPRLELILNQANEGFAAANNQGIRAAAGADWIVLLNNDTIVTPGWLTGLIRYLENPQVGLVGPVTGWAGNEARIEIDYQGPEGIDAFARRCAAAHPGRFFDIDCLAMFCVALRRDVLEQVGELDQRFGIGMFEDDDYARRVREAGFRTICAEDVFVHHKGRACFGALEKPEYTSLFEENRRRYEEKWAEPWKSHKYRSWDYWNPEPGRLCGFDPERIDWECNICGAKQRTALSALHREEPSCPGCRSSVRTRSIIHCLSMSLFGRSLPLACFPSRPDLKGIGLSDWGGYAAGLERKLSYRNTFFDREPRLDITAPDPELEGSLDFLIASEVFEHVLDPVERAFLGARKLLKPGGVLILTVPYQESGPTIEHYPGMVDYRLVEGPDGSESLEALEADGSKSIYPDPVFHGGRGATLEMRIFSLPALLALLEQAGFTPVRVASQPFYRHGIRHPHPWSLPIIGEVPALNALNVGVTTREEC